MKKKKILISAGGTGGHFFPAIAIAEELLLRGYDLHLITDPRCEKYITNDFKLVSYTLNIKSPSGNIFKRIKSKISLILAIINAFLLIIKIKPNVVIGFGGYPTFPPLCAAIFLKVPIILHEQNSFLGKANIFFQKFATKIALSFDGTKNLNTKYQEKFIVTGDLIRTNIQSINPKTNFSNDIFKILIIGGSQSAKIFSTLIPETLKILLLLDKNIKIEIFQQALEHEQDLLIKIYKQLGIKHSISSFFCNINELYEVSDLAIARAGASTIAELTHIGLPAIFIPLTLADNHQLNNAKAINELKGGWFFEQKDTEPIILAHKILELIQDRTILETASKNLLKRKKFGVKILADTVEKIIH